MDSLDVFEVLVRENSGMLTAFIRASVSQAAAVDDIWQDTMLAAWRRWDDYDRSRPFGAWLRGIASNNVLAWHRKHSREPLWCDESTLQHFSAAFAGIQQLAGDTFQEKLDALRACIEGLPEGYHDVIRMRYEDGMMPATVAESLSLKTETVKKHLQRAKSLLHECINLKIAAIQASSP